MVSEKSEFNENTQVNGGQEEGENILNTLLEGYFTYVQPFFWLYIASVTLFLLGALVYLMTATPLYKATTQLNISFNQLNIAQIKGINDPTIDRSLAFLNTQVAMIKNGGLIRNAYNKNNFNPDQLALLKGPEVSQITNTNLVNISIISADPKLAARAANAIAQEYLDQMHSRKTDITSNGVDVLRDQLSQITSEHDEAVQRLLEFKKENNIFDFTTNYNTLTAQLTSLQTNILSDESKAEEIKALLAEIEEDQESTTIMLPYLLLSHGSAEGGVSAANVIASKLSHLQELNLQHQMGLPELTAKFGAGALAVQIHENVGKLIKDTEKNEITIGIRGLNLTIHQLQKHQEQLKKRAEEISNKISEMDQLHGEYQRREAAVSTLERTMDLLVSRIAEIQIADATTDKMSDYAIFITNEAGVPKQAFYPVKRKVLGIGFLLGLALAGLASFVLISLNTQLTSLDMVDSFFGKNLPHFGDIPSIIVDTKEENALDDKGKKSAADARLAIIDEAFRDIRTALNLSLVTRNSKILAVCSAGSGEGKTFTASNLAKSFAQENKKVLLMDCDLRKPDAHHNFKGNLPSNARQRGISNVLVGDCKLMDVVIHMDKLNLDIATTGPVPPNPNELLSMGRLSEMLEEAKANYDIVIMDTSPLMLVSDALLIAHQNVPFLLVTRLFTDNRHVIRQMALQLKQANLFPAGLIANCADVPRASSTGYGYGYGKYGYGYGKYGYGKYGYGKYGYGKYGYGKYGYGYGKYGYGYGYGSRYGKQPETEKGNQDNPSTDTEVDKK